MNAKNINVIKNITLISISILFSIICVLFAILYIDTISQGYIYTHSKIFKIFAIISAILISFLCFIFVIKNQNLAIKIMITFLFFIAIILMLVYLLKITQFWDKVNDIEDLRNYVSSFGANAVCVFLLMQILQVVVLPVPGVVAIGAGVALFGVKLGALYSLIGILLGSFIAYYIGKFPGEKVVSWLVGRNNLEKTLKKVEGKDKLVLTFMFLFPFFPDDVLCFVAGMSSMSQIYFAIMILITRIIGVYTTAYSVNGNLIPYNTVWGIIVWGILIISTFVLTFFINKYGKKLEMTIKNLFKRKK